MPRYTSALNMPLTSRRMSVVIGRCTATPSRRVIGNIALMAGSVIRTYLTDLNVTGGITNTCPPGAGCACGSPCGAWLAIVRVGVPLLADAAGAWLDTMP